MITIVDHLNAVELEFVNQILNDYSFSLEMVSPLS